MADFLSLYLDYTAECEAPQVFAFWCAIVAASHALNRNVFLDMYTAGKIYPGQIMVCLVSDSAVSRKTTAINTAVDLLEQLPDESVNIIEGQRSAASLLDSMKRGVGLDGEALPDIGLIVADELGAVLSKEAFAETLPTDIAALNTARDRFSRKMRSGSVELERVCLGMLAGTTPTGLAHELPKAAQRAGFLGRLLCVYASETDRINPLVDPPKDMKKQRTRLIQHLYRMAALRGEFTYDAKGKAFLVDWYTKHRQGGAGRDESTGFYGRKDAHIRRVAMTLAACYGNELILTEPILQSAVAAIDQVQMYLPDAHQKLGASMHNENQDRILSVLEKYGAQPLTKMMERLWRHFPTSEHLRLAVNAMIDADLIEMMPVGGRGTSARCMQRYRIKKTHGDFLKLVSNEAMNDEGD